MKTILIPSCPRTRTATGVPFKSGQDSLREEKETMEITIMLIDVVLLFCGLLAGLAIEEIIDGIRWAYKRTKRGENEAETK